MKTGVNSVGLPWEVVKVTEIGDDGLAEVTNHIGKQRRIKIGFLRAKGALPRVGERWVIDKSMGYWTFAAVIEADPPVITGDRSDGTALANLLTALADMGLIVDETTA